MFCLRRVIIAAGLPLMAALAGCALTPQPPPPLLPPDVSNESRQFIGTPLSGPLAADPASIQTADALAAKVTFIALEKMPATVFEPLGPRARLIIATRAGEPVLPSGRLTLGVRFQTLDHAQAITKQLTDDKFGRNVLICSQDGMILRGATASFSIEDRNGEADVIPGQNAVRQITLELHRPQPALQDATEEHPHIEVGLAVNDFVNPNAPQGVEAMSLPQPVASVPRNPRMPSVPPPPATQPALVYQAEIALFNQAADPGTFALYIPMRFHDSQTTAVVLVVEISPTVTDAAHQAAVARAVQQITDSSKSAAAAGELIGSDPADWPGLSGTIASLAWSDRQRAALTFLAAQTGANITEDVALAAGESTLSDLAQRVQHVIAAAPDARNKKSIGWLLERTTLRMLLQMQTGGKIAPELSGILALHAGEAGRHPETLEEVLANVGGQQDLQNRLAAENYIFLEDSSPASRVRAFDWLSARKLAPAGFDPLGGVKQRRAALDRAQDAAASQPSQP